LLKENDKYKPITCGSKLWKYCDEPMKYFIDHNKSKIQLYRQNVNTPILDFKIGNDGDVELILESEMKNNVDKTKQIEFKNIELPVPETTEQIVDAVFSKTDIKPKQSISPMLIPEPVSSINLNKLKCDELRKMAEEKDIKTTIRIDGKTRRRTKQELIDAILKN